MPHRTNQIASCPVEAYQSEWELAQLIKAYRKLKPRRVLEIGTLLGGTLWHWLRETKPGAHVAAIDLLVPYGDPRHNEQKAGHDGLWQQWAKAAGQTLTVINGKSSDPRTLEALPFDSVDFLFIDGDHHYEAVKRDYELYAPLVREGGLIAFHDIDIDEGSVYHGVKPLWREIKDSGVDVDEWIEERGWWGIGVVHV